MLRNRRVQTGVVALAAMLVIALVSSTPAIADKLVIFKNLVWCIGFFQPVRPAAMNNLLQIHVPGRRTPATGNQMVFRRVHCNTVQPCIKRAVTTEPGNSPVRLNKGFLHNIFLFRRVFYEPAYQVLDSKLVLLYEQVEGLFIPVLDSLHQIHVVIVLFHQLVLRPVLIIG